MKATGQLCKFHGGTCNEADAAWLCDECARRGINKCACGGHARGFGEAMMSSVHCESCDQHVAGVNVHAESLWNSGVRGWIA